MIIILDESISTYVDSLTSEEWIAIGNLATASREGKHRVVIDRSLALKLAGQNSQLTPVASSFYSRKASAASTQYDPTVKKSPVYINVLRSSNCIRTEDDSQIVFEVPLDYFSDSSKIQGFALVCENLNDCKLFLHLAKYFRSKLHLNAWNIQFEMIQGGGSTTSEVLRDKLDRKLFTLAITDSDRDYPSDRHGDTAKSVQNLCEHHSSSMFADHIVLGCKEIENLLPDDLLASLPTSDKNTCDKDIIRLMSDHNCWLRLYCDMKKGVRLNYLLRLKQSLESSYWDSLQPIIQKAVEGNLNQCFDNNTCNVQNACSCIILNGLGKCIITEVLKINLGKFPDLWNTKCDQHSEELNRVLSKLVYWGMADKRQIT